MMSPMFGVFDETTPTPAFSLQAKKADLPTGGREPHCARLSRNALFSLPLVGRAGVGVRP